MSKIKVYPSNGYVCTGWLDKVGIELVSSISKAEVVSFAGGADINPQIYGQRPNKHTFFNGSRDRVEVADFKEAFAKKKKIIGICRGLQLICAMSGGRLIQHVSNHHGNHVINVTNPIQADVLAELSHPMRVADSRTITVNSIHHQMIDPYNLNPGDYTILGWSNRLSTTYIGENNKELWLNKDFREIEVCKFHTTDALGWQYHPEMMGYGRYGPALDYTIDTFIKFINNEI